MSDRDTLLKILDLARWAPSGDNTQPWRFEIAGEHRLAIYGYDTRDHVIYDFNGHASHMAHGALLETLRIAATGFGLEVRWNLRSGCPDTAPVYDVFLDERPDMPTDPLFSFIEKRVVQRRLMQTAPLTDFQREALATAPGGGYELLFFEGVRDRLKVAKLLWRNAYIRLTCPEAFRVHREIIEWGAYVSKDRIPEHALGIDPITAKLMKWVMQSWNRVAFFNRYLLGTIPPRIQLDFLPAISCAAHVLLRPCEPLRQINDYVHAGIAMQRLWLTATAVGLHLQPEMTPVIFHWYVRAGKQISTLPHIDSHAKRLAKELEALAHQRSGGEVFAFLGRVGLSEVPRSRSIRKGLQDLLMN